MRKIILLPIIFTLFFTPCLSQQNSHVLAVQEKPFDIKDYEGWQKIELKYFTFYIPPELKKKEVKCYEICYQFESNNLLLSLDINIDAGRPTFEIRYPSYLHSFTEIDGKSAWLWFYEDKGDYKYKSGVNFWDKASKRWGVGVYLFSKTTDTKQTAEKIFRSIKFNNHTL